jgi:DNA-binding GntR family transcriptional regulator
MNPWIDVRMTKARPREAMESTGSAVLNIVPRRGGEVGFKDWSPDLRKARVYDQILLDIILGVLAPGSRLDEQGLARRYGAGLAGVRDALGRLALEGLVDRRPRAGTTVSPLDLIAVKQGFEARGLIEPHCAALAAIHATAEDVAALSRAFDGGEAAIRIDDCRALVDMDRRFHMALARASANATLARILIPLQYNATRYWVYSMASDTKAERVAEIGRHREVADRIARRDPEGARTAMQAVLGFFPESLRRVIGGGTSPSPRSCEMATLAS